MAGNPRENVKDKGFWDGGAPGHGRNNETAGRPSGSPGMPRPRTVGVKTDLEYPPAESAKRDER
jgi:hypothetical protein